MQFGGLVFYNDEHSGILPAIVVFEGEETLNLQVFKNGPSPLQFVPNASYGVGVGQFLSPNDDREAMEKDAQIKRDLDKMLGT